MAVDNVFIRHRKKDNAAGAVWLIHGFGGSGGVFTEAFSSGLADHYSLFAPDFPGFGASPPQARPAVIEDSVRLLAGLVRRLSGDLPVFLVGHSLGGIVATRAAMRLEPRVSAYVNIEGNLTGDDTFVTGLSAAFTDGTAFKRHLIDLFAPAALKDEALSMWLADLRAADPESLLSWAKDCVSATGEQAAGEQYRDLACKTLYLWGEKSISQRSRGFLEKNGLNNRGLKGCGHLPMVEAPAECWQAVYGFFTERTK
jgi:pimeloyl-ACP methyl ester carboxylesterase